MGIETQSSRNGIQQEQDEGGPVTRRTRKIIVNSLGVSKENVKPDSHFVNDLNADDIDLIDLFMAFEEEFKIDFPDEYIDSGKLLTLNSIVNHVNENSNVNVEIEDKETQLNIAPKASLSTKIIEENQVTDESNLAIFVFNSSDSRITGNYALHAKSALRSRLGENAPMVLDERWEVLSGDLLSYHNIMVLISLEKISPNKEFLTETIRKGFESGKSVGFLPYLIGTFNCPRNACIHADQDLKKDKVAGYHGVILFELPPHEELQIINEVSSVLSLPMTPLGA